MSRIEHDLQAQSFSTLVEGQRARLQYRLAERVMTITHTEVPPPIGGRGIAAALVNAAVATAREQGWTVNPACSYAASYLRRQPA